MSLLHKYRILFVKDKKDFKRIRLDDVLYIKHGERTLIFMNNEQIIETCYTLRSLEFKLDTRFVRINHSTIVNISRMDYIHKNNVIIDGAKLELSMSGKTNLLKKIFVLG